MVAGWPPLTALQCSRPTLGNSLPPIPVQAFPSRGSLDVDGLIQQEFLRSPGPVDHQCVFPVNSGGSTLHTAGVSENIRRVCQKFGMKVAFRSSQSLRSMLTKVKVALPVEKQTNVVYQILCSCGKSYIGETKRKLETRLRKHQDACRTQSLQKSAVAEHA